MAKPHSDNGEASGEVDAGSPFTVTSVRRLYLAATSAIALDTRLN